MEEVQGDSQMAQGGQDARGVLASDRGTDLCRPDRAARNRVIDGGERYTGARLHNGVGASAIVCSPLPRRPQ